MKEKIAFSLFDLATKIESVLLALLFLFLPTQLGKHFWPQFSLVNGIRVDYLSPTIYFTDILIGLLFLSTIGRLFLRLRKSSDDSETAPFMKLLILFRHWKAVVLFFILFLFLTLNIMQAERSTVSLYYGIKVLEFAFLGYYIALHIKRLSQLRLIAVLLSIGVFFESLLAILQYINQGSLNGWLYFLGERTFNGSTPGIANAALNGELILRPYGTLPHPNVLSGYLLLSSIIIYFFQVRIAKGFLKWLGVFILLLGSIAILLSLSRVAIGLWVLLVVFFLFFQVVIRLRTMHSITFGVLLLVGGFLFAIVSPLGQSLIDRFSQTSLLEESFTQRSELLQSSLIIIQNHPLLGVGLGNFIPALAPLQDPLSIGLYLQPVHTIYLLIASETGFIGLLCFIFLIVATLKRLRKKRTSTPLFRSEFLVFTLLLSLILTIGLFDHYFISLQQGQLLFAIILGLCWTSLSTSS